MKELINTLSNPIYSFSFAIIAYVIGVRKIEWVANKKFGWAMMIGTLVTMVLMFFDKNFRVNFGLTTDNVPILFLILLVLWTCWYSVYKGVRNDKRIEEGLPPLEGTPENREKVWAWPNLVYTELFAIIAATAFLIVWAIFFKGPLEEPANPTWAPNPAKAPWYFLGLQEILVYFDPWIAGVVLPGLIVVGLIAIPFIDVNPKGNGYYSFKERKFAMVMWLFGWLVLWQFLIVVGTFLRGPNWTFYGPFEVWDAHKVVAENNINFADIIWIRLFNTSLPASILVREIFGLAVIALYFVGGTIAFTKTIGKEFLEKMGSIRYYIMIALMLVMFSLPIKMYLRWFIGLKYIVSMPEFEFNI